jgi:ATP-dependent helicase/nuclease subunit A
MSALDLVIPDATKHSQRRAADPGASAWVSANAGAGKTKVLTDRVIRLLLAGAPPGRILCLTFTKAAAAEMTNRVFAKLGSWVTLEDSELRAVLEELTGERPSRATTARARRLFARAVETPGGLKIETIHAFCERILHLVPFEANVPARFAVLDESQTGELLATARAKVLAETALRVPSSEPLARALEIVNLAVAGEDLTRTLDRAVQDERVPADPDSIALALRQLAGALDLGPGETAAEIRRRMLEDGLPASEWFTIAAELRRTGKSTDVELAEHLEAAAGAIRADARLASYRKVFFTDKGLPRKKVGTNGVDPGVRALLEAERERLDTLSDRLAAAETLERNAALFTLAGAIRARRDTMKAALGALDFDDLIKKTLDLLTKASAAWVLYKLDRGIDHVLVDEAQDTNPDQWRILRLLTEEFTAGEGREQRGVRTLFAVGDPKQSIYSFQGADPRWFEDSRRFWLKKTKDAELRFEDVRLDLSFRSAPAVLSAVDSTFRVEAHYRGLSYEDRAIGTVHKSARPKAPGHVEIWHTQERETGSDEPDAWSIPVDEPERSSPAVVVAGRVAESIRDWIRTGDADGRWRPRDILILARKRGPAFFAVIRALKSVGVPVAGADRFDIGEHIAVNDLVAIGQAALLPQNDLVLAAALKSPLVGLDDDDLIRIAADRGESETLAAALDRHAASGDEVARRGGEALALWRERARAEGPFGFYLGLLGPGGGRQRLVERLGHEAADAIDAFLTYAQTSEIGPDAPSLTNFLAKFDQSDHTIKRDLDSSGDEVKVMTVHGAKGLEAPVVVLIDGCEVHGEDPKILELDGGTNSPVPVWSPSKSWDCAAVADAREAARAKNLEEHNRLLYVAMTRAKDRLVIAPFAGARGGESPESWCAMVRRGLAEAAAEQGSAVEMDGPHGPVLVWRDGIASPGAATSDGEPTSLPELPDWLLSPVEPEPEPAPPLRPSGVLGAAERSGRAARGAVSAAEARRHGILVHALIEHLADLAPSDRHGAAIAFLGARASRVAGDERDHIVADAMRVLDHAALADLFGPNSRGEAPLVGEIPDPVSGEPRAVSGQVDRIVVSADEIIVADFKTGARRAGAPVPQSYLGQLALYRALLSEAYPGRRVRTLLVWTSGPEIVEPEAEALDAALVSAFAEAGA